MLRSVNHGDRIMNVLLVYAHPEPRSLNGALKDFSVARLEESGHAVQVSDLYAMNWKAPLDASDSVSPPPSANASTQASIRSTRLKTACKARTSHWNSRS